MTVSGNVLKMIYTLDESTTVFPYTFKITEDADMKVTLYTTATGAETVLTLTTDYTVTGAGEDSGTRNVTWTGATSYGSAYQLILQPNLAYTQPSDYEENDDFAEETHEDALDRLCILVKQNKELLDRTFKLDASQEDAVEFTPGTGYLYSDGTNYSFNDISVTELDYDKSFQQGADASKSATPSVGDQYFATDTNKQYRCVSNNSWTLDNNFGDITCSGNCSVSGTVSFGDTLTVSGATSLLGALTVSGSQSLGGTLNVGGAVTLSGAVSVAGKATLSGGMAVDLIGAPTTYHVTKESSTTTVSTSYENLSDMTLTFTPSNSSNPILILFDCNCYTSQSTILFFIVDIGGDIASSVGKTFCPANGEYKNVALHHYTTLSATEKTVLIQWKTDAGTGTCYERRLTVIEFKQN